MPVFLRFLEEAGLRRVNYAGKEIPLGAGLFIVVLLPFLLSLALLAGVPDMPALPSFVFGFAVVGFGLAGLIDDCLGSPGDKGFRGHFTALFREGRLTSGALKALFGGTVALLVGLALAVVDSRSFGRWYQVLLNAVLLAGAANLVNLFDLRPGRAGKVYFLALIVCAALAREIDRFYGPVILLAVMFLPVFWRDLRADLMLGDTGANLLGAALGMAMIFWLTPHAKIVAAAILVILQVLSERFSYSALIERVGILRIVDNWGRGKEI